MEVGGGLQVEAFNGEWHYEIVPQRGRLHIAPALGKFRDKPEPGLTLQMTARGPISREEGFDLGSGLDRGHEAVVQAFLNIVSDEAKRAWGLKEGTHE
jgi:hypothetical protein